jgi:hypothetical protein
LATVQFLWCGVSVDVLFLFLFLVVVHGYFLGPNLAPKETLRKWKMGMLRKVCEFST